MKKFLKGFLKFFCLPVAILALIIFAPAAFIRYGMPEKFEYQDSTAHFNIYYNGTEKDAIDDIKNRLENNYERITSDLKQPLDKPTTIKIYPDLNTFHSTLKLRNCEGNGLLWWINILFGGEYEPWVVGVTDATTREIRIVSPLNPGENGYTYDAILSVVIHEFTHAVVLNSTSNMLASSTFGRLINEGIAVYEADQGFMFEKEDINSELLQLLPESIDKLSVSSRNSYSLGYSFVKYVVGNYGYDKLIELLKKNYIGGKYDTETRKLYDEWVEYLKSHS